MKAQNRKPRFPFGKRGEDRPGGVLLSHSLTRAVPSALEGLTSEFGMGSGMAPPTLPPEETEVCHSANGAESGDSTRIEAGIALTPNPELEPSPIFQVTSTFALEIGQAARTISTGQLHALPRFHLPPITSWSTRVLQGP